MRWTAVIACVVAQTVAAENEPPIYTQYLQPRDPAGKASVALECDHVGLDGLACRYTHIQIEYLANPEELDAEIARELAEFRRKVKSTGLKSYVESLCGSTKEDAEDNRRVLEHLRSVGRRKSAQDAADLVNACDNPTEARLEEYLRQHVLSNSRSCMVSLYQRGPVRLIRTSPGKWAGTGGPYGECNERYAYTLEHDPKDQNSKLIWSHTLTSVDTSGSCKRTETGKKMEFSSVGYAPEVGCESIQFFRWW